MTTTTQAHRRPRRVNIPLAIAIAGVAGITGFALDAVARSDGWSYPSVGSSAALTLWGLATITITGIAIRATGEQLTPSLLGLEPTQQHNTRPRTPLALVGLGASLGLMILVDQLGIGAVATGRDAYSSTHQVAAVVLLIELLIRYPITVLAEEALFRGWLQPRLPAGVLVSALLWAGFHLQQIPTIPALIPFGIALGTLRWWTGSIRVPLAVHYLANATFLLTAYA